MTRNSFTAPQNSLVLSFCNDKLPIPVLCCAQSLSCVRLFSTPRPVALLVSSVHRDSPGKNIGVDCHALLKGIFPPRDQTQISCIAGRLLTELPGKPMNIGVGSLSLLQGTFPTQEMNWGLLHCRQILQQLSYQGCPIF